MMIISILIIVQMWEHNWHYADGKFTSVDSLQGNWLAARMADLTRDLHRSLAQGSISLNNYMEGSGSATIK